ncbi:MAG: glycosyltransferase family 2 protein [Chloroflexota bacterium]
MIESFEQSPDVNQGMVQSVSVIIPCYNEEKTISLLLDAIYRQTYPRHLLEVIIADGGSVDDTRKRITDFQQSHPDLNIRVIDNPKRIIPAALNRAIEASSGEIILRLDAHCVPAEDYIARSVHNLNARKGDNVGGLWIIEAGGAGWLGHSIAVAAAHRLGVGDARYRYSRQPGQVDTVPFGAFRRSLIEKIGGYDETLLTNEDYELNTRIRQNGGIVFFDPAIRSTYYARPNLTSLARQYWRYGYWKWRMLRRYPRSLRLRQLLPPLFVLTVALMLALSIFFEAARIALVGLLILYGMSLILSAIPSALQKRQWFLVIGVPLAIATMHFCWGAGFLVSMIRSSKS